MHERGARGRERVALRVWGLAGIVVAAAQLGSGHVLPRASGLGG